MAASRSSYLSFGAVTVIFFLALTLLPLESISGGIKASMNEEELKKMVLGSKPPACVNKCMRCSPCQATLVIPPHKTDATTAFVKSSHDPDDDTYYLLSWKCTCGNNIYHP